MALPRTEPELDTANRLRRNVADIARLPPTLSVEDAVSAVMCALTERLTAGQAHHVLVSVPPAVARLFEVCVKHRAGKPTASIDRADFVARVGDHLGLTPAHTEIVCSAVFNAVRAELPAEVAIAVGAQLPHGLKELWLGPPVDAPDLDVAIPPRGARQAIEADLERRARLPLHVTPAAAFAGVMCCFARRLSGGEVRHVLLGLPESVRPLIEHCATHRAERAAVFGREELLRDVADHLITSPEDAERITLEVLRAVKRALPQLTSVEIASQLPSDLFELWETALPAHGA